MEIERVTKGQSFEAQYYSLTRYSCEEGERLKYQKCYGVLRAGVVFSFVGKGSTVTENSAFLGTWG